jgi:hypothetical protein
MDFKYSQIAQLTEFSNEKLVDIIKTKLAESENVAGALVFDDKLIVLDEETEKLYSVSYNIENRALNLENWEEINVIPDDKSRLEELAEIYFDPTSDVEIRNKDLVESFKLRYSDEPFRRLINKASMGKRSIEESNSKIKALKELRKVREEFNDEITELMEDDKIKALANSVNENSPTQHTITKINFKHPISVSLFEENSDRIINLSEKKKKKINAGNVRKKVRNLWTSESFKEDLKATAKKLDESDEEVKVLESFFNNHSEILVLEENEIEDLILKTSLMIGESKNSEQLTQLVRDYYNLEEIQEARQSYISRNMLTEGEGEGEGDAGEEDFDFDELGDEEEKEGEEKPKKASKKDKETSIDEDSINKIIKVLNEIREKLEEDSTQRKFVDGFIQSLEDAKVGSISEGKLKGIIDFLSSVYQDAKTSKEEEK